MKHKIPCLICDIDGTLALRTEERGPFEWDKVDLDLVNQPILELLSIITPIYKIILVSGRNQEAKEKTVRWLEKHNIPHDELFMRDDGDVRADDVVKEEIYRTKIEPLYDVMWVIDDRLRVCRMWHKLGLTLLRVGDPDADF